MVSLFTVGQLEGEEGVRGWVKLFNKLGFRSGWRGEGDEKNRARGTSQWIEGSNTEAGLKHLHWEIHIWNCWHVCCWLFSSTGPIDRALFSEERLLRGSHFKSPRRKQTSYLVRQEYCVVGSCTPENSLWMNWLNFVLCWNKGASSTCALSILKLWHIVVAGYHQQHRLIVRFSEETLFLLGAGISTSRPEKSFRQES